MQQSEPVEDWSGNQPTQRHTKTQFESDQFQFAMEHVEKLLDRRQTNTSFYLSINTGILALIGIVLSSSKLAFSWNLASILLLAFAGFAVCWVWRSLLHQYEVLLDWWYARLRELEEQLPIPLRLVTREYQDLYTGSSKIGMTRREFYLSWTMSVLYSVVAIGAIILLRNA